MTRRKVQRGRVVDRDQLAPTPANALAIIRGDVIPLDPRAVIDGEPLSGDVRPVVVLHVAEGSRRGQGKVAALAEAFDRSRANAGRHFIVGREGVTEAREVKDVTPK